MELEDRHAAEQIGAEHDAARPPGRENHQRQGDPAAPGGHVLDPHRRIDERKIGPADAGHRAAERHREIADADHRVADRVRGVVGFADRAEHEAAAGAVQEPGHRGDQREGQIDQRVVAEQHRADERSVAEAGDRELRQGVQRRADIVLPEQRAEPDPENGEGEPGGDLVGDEAQSQKPEEERERRAGQRAGGGPGIEAAGSRGDRKGAHRADQHHALDAEVEDPGFLGHQLAEGREQQRRRRGDHRDQDRGRGLQVTRPAMRRPRRHVGRNEAGSEPARRSRAERKAASPGKRR